MMWNVETEWQVNQLRHQELLQRAQRWRLFPEPPQLPVDRRTSWQGVRYWLGCRLITLGEWLAVAPPSMRLDECHECS